MQAQDRRFLRRLDHLPHRRPFQGRSWNAWMVDRGAPVSAIWTPAIAAPAPRDLCTDCGVSRSSDPKRCGQACQFIKPDYPALEARVHGRSRDRQRTDELFFGPFRRMVRASLAPPREGAQWTGIATRLGERSAGMRRRRRRADDGTRSGRQVETGAGVGNVRGSHGAVPRHANGIRAVAGVAGAGAGARFQTHRGHRNSLPGLRAAIARGRARLREDLCRGNALLRQHHHGQLPYLPRTAVRPARYDHLSRVSRGLSCRAALQ